MKALLSNYRQSPRKVRLIADLIRGKSVRDAKHALMFLPKKSAPAVEKLLDSAVANARTMGVAEGDLFVKVIRVDKGIVMRRARPFARGRSGTIRKVMSIVNLELGARTTSAAKKPVTRAAKTTKGAKHTVKPAAKKAKAE